MDVLTDVLQRSRARGAAFSRTTFHGSWGVRFPGTAALAVHAVLEGDMYGWVHDPGRARHLVTGDVVLVRTGTHHVGHAPGAPCRDWAEVARGPGPVTVGLPADGPPAVLFCGAYLFEGDLSAPLLHALPDLVRLRPAPGSALRVTLDLLAVETATTGAAGPGQQALLDRLLDVALVQSLRAHFATAGAAAPGWFRAMADDGLAAALALLHAEPERAWTVDGLAAVAHLSRTAFARRFTEMVGRPPLTYLGEWRVALAKERLRDTDDSLATIAAGVGYGSAFSFAAAFKRQTGVAPGRWRAQARAASVVPRRRDGLGATEPAGCATLARTTAQGSLDTLSIGTTRDGLPAAR